MKNECIRPLQGQLFPQKVLQRIAKIVSGITFCIFSPLKCQNNTIACRVKEPGGRGTNISTKAKINILFASTLYRSFVLYKGLRSLHMKATYISAIRNSIVTQKSNHFDFHPEAEIQIAPFDLYRLM